jgi:hypothetical protein
VLQPRELQHLVARAFTAPEVWTTWFPPIPVEPAPPALPAPPECPERPAAGSRWWERQQYPERVAAYLVACEAHPLALRRHQGRLAAHQGKLEAHKAAMRRYPGVVRDGKLAADAHGKQLLELAVRGWFGTR